MNAQIVHIQSAGACPPETFVQALNDAYADYLVPIHLTPTSLQHLIERESVVMSASRIAMHGDTVVGMGLLGVRQPRSWIGGMGVIPDYRRQGIARRLMEALVAQARELGLETIQLEVIQENKAAYTLYDEIGFKTRRELKVLVCREDRTGALPDALFEGITVRSEQAETLLDRLDALPGAVRPWQREKTTLRITLDSLHGQAAYRDDQLCGICLYNGKGGLSAELSDLAATNETVGMALLAKVLRGYPTTTFTYLNIDEDDPMLPALYRVGFEDMISQYEMFLPLL